MAHPSTAVAPLDLLPLGTATGPIQLQQQKEPTAPSPATTAASTDSSSGSSSAGARKRKPAAAPSPPPSSTTTTTAALTDKAWTPAEDERLRAAVKVEGARNWKLIAAHHMGGQFSDIQCLHRWQKVLRPGLVKGPWTKEEDAVIIHCMATGVTKWAHIAERVPGRLGKQCRERWLNHLDPSIKKTGWTPEEDAALIAAHAKLGNAWCLIAAALPGRSENAVKNRWHSAAFTRLLSGRASPQQPPKKRAAVQKPPPPMPPPAATPAAATAPMSVAVPAPAQKEGGLTPIKPSPQLPPQQRGQDDMESISSISSVSTASMAESEPEESEPEQPAQTQRSQLPPRHRGLQHHAAQHAKASKPAVVVVTQQPSVTPLAPAGFGGLAGLALAASALSSPAITPQFTASHASHLAQSQQQQQQPSQHMRATISLLFAAMRVETDSTRRALLQDALDAATQERPAITNFVDGVLGGSSIDLDVEGDRLFLLDQILAATHRGIFGPRTFRF